LNGKPFDHNNCGPNCLVRNYRQVTDGDFASLTEQLNNQGYSLREERQIEQWHYAAFTNGEDAYFVNYFPALAEMNVVKERNSNYFSFMDHQGESICTPQVTQVHVNNCGMSYAIRLSDGRFIVIDGGWEKEYDVNSLFSVLKEGSSKEKPVIAAWIQSHPHIDHFRCFMLFMKMFADQVTVQKMIFHFPDADDFEHYPSLCVINQSDPDYQESESACIHRMLQVIQDHNIPIYTPHSGQIYRIGDAMLHFLGCIDDTVHRSTNVNYTSLVFRMELAGQSILWTGDAGFSELQLPGKCPAYLKSDILQIPHHGFRSGTCEGEIKAYSCIRPKVCFLPAEEHLVYSTFCPFVESTRYILTDCGVDELFVCDKTHTITLPYTPNTTGYAEYLRKFRRGRESIGAYSWIFTDLNTGNPSDLEFSVANFLKPKATVSVTMVFEDLGNRINTISFEAPRDVMRRIRLNDVSTLLTGPNKEIPKNVPFAVHFNSTHPIVISNKYHTATYRSQNID